MADTAAARSIEVPLNWVGDPSVSLEELSETKEWKLMANAALSRGLQKPPIMTDPQYAEDVSGSIDMSLSGISNQDGILAGIKNADTYEAETQGQAYRRLWNEAMSAETPTLEDQMVFQYSGVTFDPRLDKIVSTDPGNIFATKSEDVSGQLRKSFMSFSKNQQQDPVFKSQQLLDKQALADLARSKRLIKGGSDLTNEVTKILGGLLDLTDPAAAKTLREINKNAQRVFKFGTSGVKLIEFINAQYAALGQFAAGGKPPV